MYFREGKTFVLRKAVRIVTRGGMHGAGATNVRG
jgi:hypothetical protein